MSLEDVIKKINKEFKSNVCDLGLEFEQVQRIPFSSPSLNYMTYGGIPVGRIIEFSGAESNGKTTLSLDICGNAQKLFPDKKVLFVDIEQTFDPDWATLLGVNVAEVLMYRPPEGVGAEKIFQDIKDLVESGGISLVVIDSLGAMVSSQAYNKTLEDRTYGGISMALTNFGKQMIPICTRTSCTLIGINQMRDDLNSPYGGTTTTGGKAWRHSCSVRIEFRKGSFVDEKNTPVSQSCENPAGHIVEARLIKSKVCRLDRKIAHFVLKYLTGIDYISDVIDIAVKNEKIVVGGSWYSIINPETGEVLKDGETLLKFQGKQKIAEFLKQHSEWCEQLQRN